VHKVNPKHNGRQSAVTPIQEHLHRLFSSADGRQIKHRLEVFDLFKVADAAHTVSAQEFQRMNGRICNDWNPLFQSGCRHRNCPKMHLNEGRFLRFVKFVHLECRPDVAAEYQFQRAIECLHQRKNEEARSMLLALSARYQYIAVINFWIARSYHLMAAVTESDMQSANLFYRRALAISPGNGSLNAFYGEFSVHFGQLLYPQMTALKCSEYKQAKHHLNKSLMIEECPAVHFVLARFLDEVEREYPNASFHYRLAIEGGDDRIRLNYGRLKHKMGRLEEAKRQFVALNDFFVARNLSASPSSLWAHFHFGRLLIDKKEYDVARQQFEVCLEIMARSDHRFFAVIFYEFAKLLLFGLGQRNRALDMINIAVREAPDMEPYRELLDRITIELRNEQQQSRLMVAQQDADCNKQRGADPVAEHEIKEEEQRPFPETPEMQKSAKSLKSKTAIDFGDLMQRIESLKMGPLSSQKPARSKSLDIAKDDEQKEHSVDPSEAINVSNLSAESLFVENHLARYFEEQQQSDDDGDFSSWSVESDDDEFADRLCQNEFDRFIASSNSFGDGFDAFYDRLEDEEMNDVRCLLTAKMVDEVFLRETIGMDAESTELWRESVSEFVQKHKRFEAWLKRVGFHQKYYEKLENNAILTLQSFAYHNQDAKDLVAIIGDRKDADGMWQSAKVEMQSMSNHC